MEEIRIKARTRTLKKKKKEIIIPYTPENSKTVLFWNDRKLLT